MKYGVAVYHSVALCHHLYAMKYTSEIEFHKSSDQRVAEMERFGFVYFTSWNMIIQSAYLFLTVVAHFLHILPVGKFHGYENKLLKINGYIFTTLVFPCSFLVSVLFWGVYSINREWVLPEAADSYVPSWLNHSMHSVIVVVVILEIFITNHLMPSFKSAFLGLTALLMIYNIIFLYTYYQCGRWVYGLFYILDWQQRYFVMFSNYVITIVAMKAGIALQNYKGIYRDLFYNWIKDNKIL